MEKKLQGNYTRMLLAIINKSWRQHPTKQQLYSHLPLITKTIQVKRTRHVGHCWRSKDELISDILLWTSSHGRVKAWQPARTYIQQLSSVPIQDVALKTSRKQWTIGTNGERGPGRPVLAAQHDDDDVRRDAGSLLPPDKGQEVSECKMFLGGWFVCSTVVWRGSVSYKRS